ncbi:MAG: hypothetical protein AB8G05_08065 [Oligoflexales bacterium]
MDDKAKVADDSDHHHEATLLTAVYVLSIPQMLCADSESLISLKYDSSSKSS